MNMVMAKMTDRYDFQGILAHISFWMVVHACLFIAISASVFICVFHSSYANQVSNPIARPSLFGVGMVVLHFAVVSHLLDVIAGYIGFCCILALLSLAVISTRLLSRKLPTRGLLVSLYCGIETYFTPTLKAVFRGLISPKHVHRLFCFTFSANFGYDCVRHLLFLIKSKCLEPIAGHIPVVGSFIIHQPTSMSTT